jgi:hypothetical protein
VLLAFIISLRISESSTLHMQIYFILRPVVTLLKTFTIKYINYYFVTLKNVNFDGRHPGGCMETLRDVIIPHHHISYVKI